MIFLLAAGRPARAGEQPVPLEVTAGTLDNGLRVLLMEDHSVPVISYQTFYRVGSRDERPGITGISHFIEQMMFNGTARHGPGEFDRLIESAGGYSNASTSKDMTVFYEEFPAGMLELVMELEADRMTGAAFDPELMKSEKEMVARERRSFIENSLEGRMREKLFSLAFRRHSYRWPILGRKSDLDSISRQDCLNHYRRRYRPGNAVLVIVGDFDTGETLRLVKKYYGPLRGGEKESSPPPGEPPQKEERRITLGEETAAAALMIGYRTPAAGFDDVYALDVLQRILDGGKSSRLYRGLVEGGGVAVSAETYFPWRMDPALFVFIIRMRKGHSPLEGEAGLYSLLEGIARRGVTEEELAGAKKSIEADLARSMEKVSGKAAKLGRYEVLLGDYRDILRAMRRYERIRPRDVAGVAESYFGPEARNVVTALPEKSGRKK